MSNQTSSASVRAQFTFSVRENTAGSKATVASGDYYVTSGIPGFKETAFPLMIEIVPMKGHFQARCRELEAEEIGASRDEAIAELHDFIRSEFAILSSTQDADLAPSALALKKTYLQYFPT